MRRNRHSVTFPSHYPLPWHRFVSALSLRHIPMASKPTERGATASRSKAASSTPKRSPRKATGRAPKGSGLASIKKVQDPLKLASTSPAPNTSAFKAPIRVPKSLGELSVPARKRMVARLVPRREPGPPEAVEKLIYALRPTVKRFHGMKVPLLWFPEHSMPRKRKGSRRMEPRHAR